MSLIVHRHVRLRSFAFVVLLAVSCVGCELPGKPDPANKPQSPDQNLSFQSLFSENCAGCHGANGEVGPAPPLNDPLFVSIVPRLILASVIQDGRAGTPMPPFATENGGTLTQQQIDVLVDGIQSHWKSDKAIPGSPPPYELPISEAGLAKGTSQRGKEVFARACTGCHGENGRGKAGGVGPINTPVFLSLISNQAIRRIIITGRPDLGMPNFAETDGRPDDFQPLTSADVDDLLALISSWREASSLASAAAAQSVRQQP